MKILIASYWFYPENTPRAFRAMELAKEFARRGHRVDVRAPEWIPGACPPEKFGFRLKPVKPGFLLNRPGPPAGEWRRGPEPRRRLCYGVRAASKRAYKIIVPEGLPSEYFLPLGAGLAGERETYDLLVSVGLPFSVHLGCFLGFSARGSLARVKVADYGDPFSLGEYLWQSRAVRYMYSLLEKRVLAGFDYITVPTGESAALFEKFAGPSRVRVVPQGFDMSGFERARYAKNAPPSFAYAGIFYPRIRNPGNLLGFLSSLERDFRFHVYTRTTDPESMGCLAPYMEKLGEKLVVHRQVGRKELIHELSRHDFLINVLNTASCQSPSKVIDYALAGRPVFECSPLRLDEKRLLAFMDGNCGRGDVQVDLSAFDIRKIAGEFLSFARPAPGRYNGRGEGTRGK